MNLSVSSVLMGPSKTTSSLEARMGIAVGPPSVGPAAREVERRAWRWRGEEEEDGREGEVEDCRLEEEEREDGRRGRRKACVRCCAIRLRHNRRRRGAVAMWWWRCTLLLEKVALRWSRLTQRPRQELRAPPS